ncbi:MAG: DUF4167 domain-containing protein [Pseudorhodoplanes sp.]|nr:DUF4167 domain-containing protein [Pseudorhodoplanes sp.]MCQ3942005.1 DUF4167 domain-containing protein [Alphaproteobacteria bacterium]GIK79826.1 MAG: hypothetical protein BroJett024_09310 [Alphaproteobacteria bacterium]
MRNGQSKHHRMRGRNRGSKSHNPLTRVYESNGPDVKIRGTANHIAEKYIQLARDATASGDPVAAENYYQHAEHYFRLIAAAQEQFRQTQPFQQQQPRIDSDDAFEGDDEGMMQPPTGGGEPHYTQREQPPAPRDFPQHRQGQPRHERGEARTQAAGTTEGDVSTLPSFITGGQPANAQPVSYGQNGHESQGERFTGSRRRRRHRGPNPDAAGGEGADDMPAPESNTQPGE